MSNRPWSAANGPREPAVSVPLPAPPALRRTSIVDVVRPDGLRGRSVIRATGHDLVVSPAGRAVVDDAWLELTADVDHDVIEIDGSHLADRARPSGLSLRHGLRNGLAHPLPVDSVARLLVDDAATVGLLGSYVEIYHGRPVGDSFARPNICAGWIDGGVLITAIRRTHDVPLPQGPLAPSDLADDENANEVRPLQVDGVRRARVIDVAVRGDAFVADAAFRDSFVDRATGTILSAAADPRVLPWVECPNAATSVNVLVGTSSNDLRATLKGSFSSVATCTHLNASLWALAGTLAAAVDNGVLNM
jgi:hypothetical protein